MIQRFKCHAGFSDPQGSWVRYDDHAAVLDYRLSEASKELACVLERLHRAEKERDVLRAECVAWREFEAEAEERSWSKAWPVHADWIADAQNATDAAGALKGVE